MATSPLHKFLRDLNRLYQTHGMYPPGHEQVAAAARIAALSLGEWGQPVRMSFVGDDLLVEDQSVLNFGERFRALSGAFQKAAWEGVRIEATCSDTDLLEWIGRTRGGHKGPYDRGGVRAGPLAGHRDGSSGEGPWSGNHPDYLPGVKRVLRQLADANPEGLELAKEIVGNVFVGMETGGALLAEARALKAHDVYTFTHVLNVSILAMGMARGFGLPEEGVRLLALGGLFHDVGKQRLPSELLNKPSRFTPTERQLMDSHPREGADILLSLAASGDVHPLLPTIAYQHHIGVNGSGYPASKWPVVPHPASRLVSVADVFDALRTIRPYQAPHTEIQAANILLAKTRSEVLDRECVAVLLALLGLLDAGRRVTLSTGASGTILVAGERDALRPLVETDEGELFDLGDPAGPQISSLHDGGPVTP